ncbi:hypothetical protein HK104_009180 [Borealophlyctis nickersoniae]|nr:hypothetical protein HK104_009180 [Borealophlyctis nickersoniae]
MEVLCPEMYKKYKFLFERIPEEPTIKVLHQNMPSMLFTELAVLIRPPADAHWDQHDLRWGWCVIFVFGDSEGGDFVLYDGKNGEEGWFTEAEEERLAKWGIRPIPDGNHEVEDKLTEAEKEEWLGRGGDGGAERVKGRAKKVRAKKARGKKARGEDGLDRGKSARE